MTIQSEGGLRPSRIEIVEESDQGTTPSNPAWEAVSDRVTTFETSGFGPGAVEKAGLGDTVHDIEAGLEEPEVTIAYSLQKWFKDSSGNPNDLSAYGIQRVAGSTPASLTMVERMTSGDGSQSVYIQPESTVEYRYNGNADATAKESRVYTVAKGCEVSEPTLTAEPSEVEWAVEATVMCDHGRSYQIDQPPSGGSMVHVNSTDSSDTGLSVVIENDDASTTETITTDGTDATTAVAGTTEFSSIDAIEIQDADGNTADHVGDIVVSLDDGGSAGEVIFVAYGSDYYGNTYGDPGVPTLGTGSHAGEIGTPFYQVGNVGLFRPPGTLFEAGGSVQTLEISIENDNERTPMQRSREQRIHIGMQTVEMSVTYDSETGSHSSLVQRMSMEEQDSEIQFDRSGNETLTLPRSVVTETPRTREATENSSEQEVTLRAQDNISISAPAA